MMVGNLAAKQIKVVHRLPGRLRLSIPTLQLIPEEYRQYIGPTETLLNGLPGIKVVSINYGTATALMQYEPATVSEVVLLGWIEQLIAAAVRFHNQLKDCTNRHLRLLKTGALLQKEVRSIKRSHAEP